jgi:type 1 fimbria pilin
MIRLNQMALIPVVLLTLSASPVVFAANGTGTITLTGKVTESSCTLTNATADLGNYNTAYFSTKGTKSRDTQVSLTLTCSSNEAGRLRFVGEQDASDSTLFKNTSVDNGIAIELTQTDGTRIDASKVADGQYPYTTTAHTPLNVDLLAHMISTTDTVTSGAVNSVITVEVAPD